MTPWAALLRKEARAIGPIGLPALVLAAAVVIAGAPLGTIGKPMTALAIVVPIGVGALSVGHDYANRTVALMLGQPVARAHMLAAKLAVLTPLLAAFALAGPTARLGALCGFFLAPWFTMLCRSALGGAVFATAVPASLWLAGDAIGVARLGILPTDQLEMMAIKVAVLEWGTVVACAAGAIGAWRTFARLETTSGPAGADLSWPSWLRRERAGVPARTHRPAVLRLLAKELRLQQMTFVVAALFVAGLALLEMARGQSPVLFDGSVEAVGMVSGAFMAVMAGALASVEERRLGTLDWQSSLPMAAWYQWSIKAGVVLGVTLVLSVGLPSVLLRLVSLPVNPVRELEYVVVMLALAVVALYVSTVLRTGLGALVTVLPVTVGVLAFGRVAVWIARTGFVPIFEAMVRGRTGLHVSPDQMASFRAVSTMVVVATIGMLMLAVLRFAKTNHQSADRSARRIVGQALWIAAAMVGAMAIVAALDALRYGRLL